MENRAYLSSAVSVRSRASRRAAEPVDKNLEPETKYSSYEADDAKPDVLAARQSGNISKRKTKTLTRKQRLRKEKGIERAFAVNDQLEVKSGRNKASTKNIKDRAVSYIAICADG